jgi:hypothetical protein
MPVSAQGQEMEKKGRDANIILFSMIIGKALSLLAVAELSDFCIGFDTVADVVRIVGG